MVADRERELRLHGLNAVLAAHARRPGAIRKLWLREDRIPALQPLLKWCVANRVGYRVVEDEDLRKLAASTHHEGVVADVLRAEPASLTGWLQALPPGPCCALWLDGVGNPHNLGAILRSAAHFGVAAMLLPKDAPLALSGAAARVAATVVKGGDDAFAAPLPERLVFVLGAEGEGMDPALAGACDLRLSIPGTGAVESLNVSAATAVLLAAWVKRAA